MTVLELTGITLIGSVLAGGLGAVTGLGGGVVIIPLLTLGLGVDIRYAIGAALISVIATSSGAAAAYVKEGFSNVRIGMFLEVATTIGAISGAYIATWMPTAGISIIFGVALLWSIYATNQPHKDHLSDIGPNPLATSLGMNSCYPTSGGWEDYFPQNVPGGFGLMYVAGVLSGLLGIGSGMVKVLAMDQVMQLPFKVSTTTSNFMIGVTAAASAGIYFSRGYIDPGLCLPVVLGVLFGSLVGAKLLVHAPVQLLRIVFSVVLGIIAVQMLWQGISGLGLKL